jgi:hypothetical protein
MESKKNKSNKSISNFLKEYVSSELPGLTWLSYDRQFTILAKERERKKREKEKVKKRGWRQREKKREE